MEDRWDVRVAGPPPSPPAGRAPGANSWRTFVAVFVLIAAGAFGAYDLSGGGRPSASASPDFWVHQGQRPPAGFEESPIPLGSPPAVVAGGGTFAFKQSADGRPVAFDPCRPVHYVIRSHGEDAVMQDAVRAAVAEVSRATGLTFVDDGFTTEAPTYPREPYQPDRYGERWAPVLIAFSDPVETPELGPKAAGLAVGVPVVEPAGVTAYVSGQVRLDTPGFMTRYTQRYNYTRVVVMHELGHVLGLAHVDDPNEVMYRSAGHVYAFGAGDRAALAQLGAGRCAPGL